MSARDAPRPRREERDHLVRQLKGIRRDAGRFGLELKKPAPGSGFDEKAARWFVRRRRSGEIVSGRRPLGLNELVAFLDRWEDAYIDAVLDEAVPATDAVETASESTLGAPPDDRARP